MHHAIFSAKLRIFLASLPPVYSRGAKYRGYFNGIGVRQPAIVIFPAAMSVTAFTVPLAVQAYFCGLGHGAALWRSSTSWSFFRGGGFGGVLGDGRLFVRRFGQVEQTRRRWSV